MSHEYQLLYPVLHKDQVIFLIYWGMVMHTSAVNFIMFSFGNDLSFVCCQTYAFCQYIIADKYLFSIGAWGKDCCEMWMWSNKGDNVVSWSHNGGQETRLPWQGVFVIGIKEKFECYQIYALKISSAKMLLAQQLITSRAFYLLIHVNCERTLLFYITNVF